MVVVGAILILFILGVCAYGAYVTEEHDRIMHYAGRTTRRNPGVDVRPNLEDTWKP